MNRIAGNSAAADDRDSFGTQVDKHHSQPNVSDVAITLSQRTDGLPRVVIIGGGFAGLNAAKALRKAPVDVVLIDRRNYHLFQPLLYQVATATLSPADIAFPIRKVLKDQRNTQVLLGEVSRVDTANKSVKISGLDVDVHYDYLIVATGSTHSYFGHEDWEKTAPGLKTIEDATEMRRRFLLAFESAEQEADPEARRAALTFVIVGGGATGVELAGAMAEIARSAIPEDFRMIDTTTTRIILIEGLERLLATYPEKSSSDALKQLEELGVEVLLNSRVTSVDADGVWIGNQRINAASVFWAAGVQASPVGATLGAEVDRAGHVKVLPDLSIPGHSEVFVAGDLATIVDPKSGEPIPHVAQGGIQMGRYLGNMITREVQAKKSGVAAPERKPFQYHNLGNLATIGRNRAVADLNGWLFGGLIAWLLWALIHVAQLITFRSRFTVMISWIWQYLFYDRGARLITGNSRLNVKVPRDPDRK